MLLMAGMALYTSYIEQLCDVKYIASFEKKNKKKIIIVVLLVEN